jgi:NAD(P)-dependent dehydrogenase (short-subunit alcohol dehydrogenase family)
LALTVAAGAPAALICGIAEGFGLSLCRALAAAGYDVLGLARSERVAPEAETAAAAGGRRYRHLACDLTRDDQVARVLAPEATRIAVAVYNAHMLLMAPFLETEPAAFERLWAVACGGAASMARALLPAMAARGSGTLIFSGATASCRAGARTAAFGAAKFALRGLSQGLAREFGPRGVHVAHVVLDGLIDEPQTDRRFAERQTSRLDPDALADGYVALIRQPKSAWTHELDVRPFDERF